VLTLIKLQDKAYQLADIYCHSIDFVFGYPRLGPRKLSTSVSDFASVKNALIS